MSAVSIISFTAIGIPASGPLFPRLSAARARSIAFSGSICDQALTMLSRSKTRSRHERIKDSAVNWPCLIFWTASIAESLWELFILNPLFLGRVLFIYFYLTQQHKSGDGGVIII